MAENNEKTVIIVDDELIERLLRGDAPRVEAPRGDAAGDPSKKARTVASSALATAIKLATEGKLDDAVKELENAVSKGEATVENHLALGHLKFEQQKWDESAEWYRKVT
ncbi:MAG: hypothetical protein LAO79_16835, partial [Acidobacteriia bacterium]|nr:hypothetical protein [Terriglobia bacterium]